MSKTCLICATPIGETSLRLGLEACRSCAAFFKRTKLAGRKFACRQGDKKCTTRKDDKHMCRRCRYDKCVKLGMELHQRKSMQILSRKETVEANFPSTSSSTLLDRIQAEYKASCTRRLMLEKVYVAKHNLQRFNHSSKEFYVANFTAFCELHQITIKECATLIRKVVADFDTFPIDHRVTLYKNFAIKFSMTEGVYFTSKYFKNTSIFASSLISCAQSKLWIPEDDKLMKDDALRTSVKEFSNDYMSLFGPMSKMEELSEREFFALVMLNYCDIETLNLPEEIVQSSRRLRKKVFEELQEYYRKELKMDDFSQRIGNLMTLVHGTAEAGILMNQEKRMYATIFDLHKDDRMFREFFIE